MIELQRLPVTCIKIDCNLETENNWRPLALQFAAIFVLFFITAEVYQIDVSSERTPCFVV